MNHNYKKACVVITLSHISDTYMLLLQIKNLILIYLMDHMTRVLGNFPWIFQEFYLTVKYIKY